MQELDPNSQSLTMEELMATGGAAEPIPPAPQAFPTRQELLPAAVVLASVATAAWTLGRGLSSLRRAE